MDLEDILAGYAPAYRDTWPAAIDLLLSDPLELRRVLDLVGELEDRGTFDDPVFLAPAETGPAESCPARVGNGMHRLCAQVLTARTDVLVTFDPEPSREGLELTWDLDEQPSADMLDMVDALSSFRLDSEHWLECEFVSAIGTHMTAVITGAPWSLGAKVLAAVTGRLRAAGMPLPDGSFCREDSE